MERITLHCQSGEALILPSLINHLAAVSACMSCFAGSNPESCHIVFKSLFNLWILQYPALIFLPLDRESWRTHHNTLKLCHFTQDSNTVLNPPGKCWRFYWKNNVQLAAFTSRTKHRRISKLKKPTFETEISLTSTAPHLIRYSTLIFTHIYTITPVDLKDQSVIHLGKAVFGTGLDFFSIFVPGNVKWTCSSNLALKTGRVTLYNISWRELFNKRWWLCDERRQTFT